MEVHSQSGHWLPVDRPDADAPTVIGDFRLPAIPLEVVDDLEQKLDDTAAIRRWSESSATSGSAVLEAALDTRVIQPQEVTAVTAAVSPEKARTELLEQASVRASRLMGARLNNWVASHGFDLGDYEHFLAYPEDLSESGEEQQPVVAVINGYNNYDVLDHLPHRVQAMVIVMVECLMMEGAPRMSTSDSLEFGMWGEDLATLKEMYRDCGFDTCRLWEKFWGQLQDDTLPLECVHEILGIGPDTDQAEARSNFDELMIWVEHFNAHLTRTRAVIYARNNPGHFDRMLKRRMAALRPVADPAETLWLDWLEFARRSLRFVRRYRNTDNGLVEDGIVMDTMPLEYTCLIDFGTPWSQIVAEDMIDMVMNSGEETANFYRAQTPEDVIKAYEHFSMLIIADCPIQAAIQLNHSIACGERGSPQLNLTLEAA